MPPNVGKARAASPFYEEVYVRGEEVTEELTEIYNRLKINGGDLGTEAEDQPALFARIAVLAEEAQTAALFMKRDLELAKARCDSHIRRTSEKKPSEDQIKMLVLLDEEVSRLNDEYLDTDRDARILTALKQSAKDRRDLIVELMRDARAEKRSYGGVGGEE